MKYNLIRSGAIYAFIIVTVIMTLLGVVAIWVPSLDGVIGRAFATVVVVGIGCMLIAYSAGLLARTPEKREALPSFAPYPKPVLPASKHLAQSEEEHKGT